MNEKELQLILTAISRRPARIEPTVFDESGGVFGGVFGGVNDAINDTVNEPVTEGIKKDCWLIYPDGERKEDGRGAESINDGVS